MIRVAAAADVHFADDLAGTLRPKLDGIAEFADLFVLAGDLTKWGDPNEAEALARELAGCPVPVVAVLGNHDYQSDRQNEVRATMERAGVVVLDGETFTATIRGFEVGVAGAKGFCGGFPGAGATAFGEPEMKAFVEHSQREAERLGTALAELRSDVRIALCHYAPVPDTLHGEPPEIFAFLGSYYLGEAIDASGAELAIHGHAHMGSEEGMTPGGVPVRNVAWPVINAPYKVYAVPAGRGNRAASVESVRA
ncbi:MAG TPA: metallophosphoesterase [Actinomycetota bacterium]